MKRYLCLLGLSTSLALPTAHAITETYDFTSGFLNGGLIPDGDPTGLADLRTITGSAINSITDISVTLDIDGTWNGDLYATLQHDTGFSVLLNRIGRTSQTGLGAWGFADTGLDVTFNDGGAFPDIHGQTSGGGELIGTFGSDGRLADPFLALDTSPRSAFLTSFNGLDANGNWTLLVADLANGSVHELDDWGMTITGTGVSTPDAGSSALMLALALAGLGGLKHAKRKS